MTDPAQVTEQVSPGMWATLGGVVTAAVYSIASVFRSRGETNAQVTVAQMESRVEMEREDTAQHRLDVRADQGAFERAFNAKAGEHRDCIEEVKQIRAESAEEARKNATLIADLRVELAECRKDHEHRDVFEKWVRESAELKPGAPPPPPPRVRPPTPANGTDIVRPAARKDPRRDP